MLQEEVRALKTDLEEKAKLEVKPEMAVVTWMIRHAGWLLCRFQASRSDGLTPFGRLRGRSYDGKLACFGETVFALLPDGYLQGGIRATPKLQNRWILGIWLGKTEDSEEHLVETGGRVGRYRCVRRYPDGDQRRWSEVRLRQMLSYPGKILVE